jgi:dipeptidyl aminopeptidase/acylaminoacyl peptidase
MYIFENKVTQIIYSIMIKRLFFTLVLIAAASAAAPQEALKYQVPPDEILKIVDAPVTPIVSISPDKSKIIVITRAPIITISELSEEELRIAGLRINPATSGPSRQTYNKGFLIMNLDGSGSGEVSGLPDNPNLGTPEWSPDGTKFAFTNTLKSGIELWVCDIASLKASKVADRLNMVFRNSYS